MRKKQRRTTQVYELKDNHKIVYFGLSYNVKRRVQEHVRDGSKIFNSCNTISPSLSRASAESLETRKIRGYQAQHGGRPPKYNLNKTIRREK